MGAEEKNLKSRIEKSIEDLEMESMDFTEDLKNFQGFDTFGRYLEFLPVGSAERKLTEFLPKLKYSDFKEINGASAHVTKSEQQYAISRYYFLSSLLAGLNSKADELLIACQYQLRLAQVILQTKDLFRASDANSQWTVSIDVVQFAIQILEGRRHIVSNLVQLRCLKLASEDIHEEFGFQLLHKSLASKIDELHKRTEACAYEYQRTLKDLRSATVPSGTEWPADLCEIDFNHFENLATSEGKALFLMLNDCAGAKMQIAFGRKEEALERLRPYLNLNGGELEEI